jgi:molybdopterin-guanine dinucleotide biosynthesis protein A
MTLSASRSRAKPLGYMNAYILTGGKSARIARDKALLTLGGRTFLDIIAGCLEPLFDRVYTAGKGYGSGPGKGDAPGAGGGAPGSVLEGPALAGDVLSGNVEDRTAGAGPLAGIHAALHASDKECNFFIGVDYPLLEADIILELARFTRAGEGGARCVVPVAPDGPHPLFAFYCRSCLPGIERCLKEGFYQVLCIARHGAVRFVRLPDEVPALEAGRIERVLTNVNRRSDYERVKNISKKP